MQTTIRSSRNYTASRPRVVAITAQHVIVRIRRQERVFSKSSGRSVDGLVDGYITSRALDALRRAS